GAQSPQVRLNPFTDALDVSPVRSPYVVPVIEVGVFTAVPCEPTHAQILWAAKGRTGRADRPDRGCCRDAAGWFRSDLDYIQLRHAQVRVYGWLFAGRRPAGGHPEARPGGRKGPKTPGPARRDRLRQDDGGRPDDPGDPAADAGDVAEQDPGRPALQRVPGLLSRKLRRVLRQLLRPLPARVLHPPDRYL